MDERVKPYRFLLRLPEEVREDLADASQRSGSSLNSEIVCRLERSLADDRRVEARGIVIQRARRGIVAFAATGAVVLAGTFALATETGARSPGRMQADSTQLAAKLAQTTSVVPRPRG